MNTSLLEIIRSRISAPRVYDLAQAYHRFPVKLSYSSYKLGIGWLAKRYREYGLDTEVLPFPADGRTVYADRHFPLAWDIDEGWARVTVPGFPDPVLADYSQSPYGIVVFSADSGGEQTGAIVPAKEILGGQLPGGADQVALFDAYPSAADVSKVGERGCRAFMACADTDPVHPSLMDARRWFNDAFGEGQIDRRHKTIVGFSLTPRHTLALLEYYRKNGPVPVRYLLKSRAYEGTAPAVTAIIEGAEHPEQSFFLTAHAYEPHATNNVAGVAVCLEAAQTLAQLIGTGVLPRPRRSIRFFNGIENFSLYAYAMAHREEMSAAVGGLTVDSLGRKNVEDTREHFVLWRSSTLHPSFYHPLVEHIVEATSAASGIGYETRDSSSNNEDLLQDPLLGPPWALLYGSLWFEPSPLHMKRFFYHYSSDTPDLLSPENLAAAATIAAVTAYAAANAGPDQAAPIVDLTCRFWSLAVAEKCRAALQEKNTAPDEIRLNGRRLSAWKEIALPAITAAVNSAGRLVTDAGHPESAGDRSRSTRELVSFAEAQIKSTLQILAARAGQTTESFFKHRLSAAERQAALAVPARLMVGPIGLGTIAEEKRAAAEKIVGWFSREYWVIMAPGTDLYWIDGRRTALDIVRAIWANKPFADREELESLLAKRMRLFDFLEECGYLAVKRGEAFPSVTGDDIRAGLQRLGIKSGDVLMVHSSLSSFGEVAGGPATVIATLTETIGPQGVLAMPAFTDAVVGGSDPAFNPASSHVCGFIGKIPDLFWQQPGVLRSNHPTHSVAALGQRATEFLSGQDVYDTFDPTGPWKKLHDWKGKILFFGESMGANTYIHALESWFLNYTDTTFARVAHQGGEREVLITHYPGGCRGNWYKLRREAEYYRRLNEQGIYRETKIGPAAAIVVDVPAFTRAMLKCFRENSAILLHKTGCADCAGRRSRLACWKIPQEAFGIRSG